VRADDITQKQGLTGKIGETAVAVYRDTDELFVFENTCPHLQCPLAWNEDEGVWDCPCHNSRFSPEGDLLRGPARQPLRRLPFEVDDGEIKLLSRE